MQAIGYTGDTQAGADGFVAFETARPAPGGTDLLVKVKAVSVNPIDAKIRATLTQPQSPPRILGWDAAGEVVAVGTGVKHYSVGDRVFYAGDISRQGSNAQYQLVDERIVGRMPQSLDFAAAAALPLTSITAWEALFDRMKIAGERDAGKRILIIGGGGGVGSMAIQLAREVAQLEVLATASHTASRKWCARLGAQSVLDHQHALSDQFRAQGLARPDFILCLADTDRYFSVMADLIAPQGMICGVVSSRQSQDLNVLKDKSAGFVWEFMFTRPKFGTVDLSAQQQLLNQVAQRVDQGVLRTTMNQLMGSLTPDNLARAHTQIETSRTVGKLVLTVD